MRITAFYARGLGPLAQNQHLYMLDLRDAGEPADRILLSGLSGSGKTTLLRALALLWRALGAQCMGEPPASETPGDIAFALEALPGLPPLLVCCAHDPAFVEAALLRHAGALPLGWQLGEGGPRMLSEHAPERAAFIARFGELMAGGKGDDAEADAAIDHALPNLLFLTDEPELPGGALPPFLVTGDHTGATLAQALPALTARDPDRAQLILRAINDFLPGKRLIVEDERVSVRLGGGASHAPGELSRGERAALALLFAAGAYLSPRGILLCDHPDMHLHPAQLTELAGALELIVQRQDGQLLITSHRPELWARYDRLGLRVRMEGVR